MSEPVGGFRGHDSAKLHDQQPMSDTQERPFTDAEIDGWRSATEPGPAINLHRVVLRRLIATIDALSAELEALGDGVQPALERFRLRAEIERLSSQAPLQVRGISQVTLNDWRKMAEKVLQDAKRPTTVYHLLADAVIELLDAATPRGET